MALQALWAPETQFQNKNGSLLVFGKIYVQYKGRSQLAKTYRDAEGTYLNTNPLLTDNDGRVLCFADDAFSYTAIVCDFYGNQLFSFDPIPCGSGSGSGSSSGSSAQHWIGINGQTQQVSRNTYTRLKLPSGLDNVDYEGDFVLGTIKGSGTEMVLKEGLYLVNTVIRFKQSSDDLTNTLSNVIVHTRDFDTPNIQEVGAVIRDEAGPDASDDIHTITLTYIRHVSQDDVGSDIIKFAVETPNTWTECYIQNLQIAKLGSSVGGGGSADQYYAGDYISIENDTISVTGIEPENYATHDELQSATSGFITSADLSGYATEQWVLDKHYITSADIPDIPEDLVTSAELSQTSGLIEQDIADLTSAISESLADKMDKSSSADFYPRYDNPEGYLTSVPSEYVTESEMSGYVHEHTSGFLTSADLPDVSDMATQTWVTEQHYITSADVPPQVEYSAGDNIDITNHVVSVSDTSQLIAGDNVSITPSGNNYIISAQIPGTSGYVTEQEMNDAIQSATSAFITSADLPDVSDMATQTWVGEQGYLTSIPSEYITETELESELSGKADTSAIPDVSHFVTQEDIDASVSGKMDATESSAFYPMATNPSGYLISSDLNGYATETYVQDETSAFITSADLPSTEEVQFEELDLSSFVDSAYVTSYVASQTSGKQDTLTFGYTDDKISSINSSAIYSTGGGGVTEQYVQDAIASGTSAFITSAELPSEEEVDFEELDLSGYALESYVDSAVSGKQDTLTFGYDSSDKINAINGSAIAGGGGGGGYEYSGANGVYVDNVNEVIGLDTSASNAIETVIENSGAWGGAGLPISAGPGIKVGLENGVLMISNDETVIYSGDFGTQGGKYLTLDESMNNFDRIKVWANDNNGWGQTIFEFDPNWVGIDNEWRRTVPIIFNTIDVGSNNVYIRGISLHAASPTNVTGVSAYGFDKSLTGNYQTYNCKITKIVGIGRKSN